MGPQRWLAALAGVLVVASIWYVQAPPRSAAAYRDRAAMTAGALASDVETAQLWIDAVRRGRTLHTTARVAFDEAEGDAELVMLRFSSYDPAEGTGPLRSSLVSAGGEVTGALAALRIAVHRGRWDALEKQAGELPALAGRLKRLESEARS